MARRKDDTREGTSSKPTPTQRMEEGWDRDSLGGDGVCSPQSWSRRTLGPCLHRPMHLQPTTVPACPPTCLSNSAFNRPAPDLWHLPPVHTSNLILPPPPPPILLLLPLVIPIIPPPIDPATIPGFPIATSSSPPPLVLLPTFALASSVRSSTNPPNGRAASTPGGRSLSLDSDEVLDELSLSSAIRMPFLPPQTAASLTAFSALRVLLAAFSWAFTCCNRCNISLFAVSCFFFLFVQNKINQSTFFQLLI